MTLRIGFANTYFTLWSVGDKYKHYFNKYEWEWRVDYCYLRNLAQEEDKAKEKAKELGVTDLEVDYNLKGTTVFFEAVDKIRHSDYPPHLYPRDLRHSHGAGEIMTLGAQSEHKKDHPHEIKALWYLYMTKKIWNNNVEVHSFKKLQPHWVKPVVYARRRLIELGELVRHDGKIMTPEYVDKYENKKLINSLKDAHNFNDGERLDLEIKQLDIKHFESEQWGGWSIATYMTKDKKKVTYKGSSYPLLDEGFNKIKATIKHEMYKDQKVTRLMRIKVQ